MKMNNLPESQISLKLNFNCALNFCHFLFWFRRATLFNSGNLLGSILLQWNCFCFFLYFIQINFIWVKLILIQFDRLKWNESIFRLVWVCFNMFRMRIMCCFCYAYLILAMFFFIYFSHFLIFFTLSTYKCGFVKNIYHIWGKRKLKKKNYR